MLSQLPENGQLPQEIRRLCEQRDYTERALRFYVGWIKYYTEDVLEMRRAMNPSAQLYAVWGLDLMGYYLDTACPSLVAQLREIESKLVTRAFWYGLGSGQR